MARRGIGNWGEAINKLTGNHFIPSNAPKHWRIFKWPKHKKLGNTVFHTRNTTIAQILGNSSTSKPAKQILENTVFHTIQCTKILEKPTFLDLHSTKLENPAFLNVQSGYLRAMACGEREERKKKGEKNIYSTRLLCDDRRWGCPCWHDWGLTLGSYSRTVQAGTNLPSAKARPLAHCE